MKITALLENTSGRADMQTEHGLSLYIETEEHNILFDMGQTNLFLNNAQKLGINLAEADIAVLSHGHYDHGGGLKSFLEVNRKAPVYISSYAFGEYYNGTEKYIGLDPALKSCDRLIFTEKETTIGEGLSLHSCNQKERKYNMGSCGLNQKEGAVFVPDKFLHEQYLLLEERGKRVLISGCSHKGILDIVSWFGPDVLVGGFHFSKFDLDGKLQSAAEILGSCQTEFYTCHCTGIKQYEYIKKFVKNAHYLSCGESILLQ